MYVGGKVEDLFVWRIGGRRIGGGWCIVVRWRLFGQDVGEVALDELVDRVIRVSSI